MHEENPFTAYRREHKMSQPQLADLIGVSYQLVNHIELGRRRITPENARAWSKKLGIPKAALCPAAFGEED